jgi:hypothetical protein
MTHIERSDPEPMVPARLLEDVRVSMKALLEQNVNAWAEVDRLHQQLRRAEEALHHITQLVREEVNAAKNLGDTQGEWWDRATSALAASDAVLKVQ